tara:strand:- start:252 stop:392 length:141 start_codon:yes stop_codon:yes gene_type:complete
MGNIICTAKDLPLIIAGLIKEGICSETIKIEHHLVEDAYQITLYAS